jgi:hypothetical protein
LAFDLALELLRVYPIFQTIYQKELTMTTSFSSSKPSAPSLYGQQQASDCDVGYLVAKAATAASRAAQQTLALPFDAIRAEYVGAVRAGLIQRSMLAQRDFERVLGTVERFSLGPWARRV